MKYIKKQLSSQTTIFIGMVMTTHMINFLFNFFLGKNLSAQDYGLVTFITSVLYLTNIIFISLIATMSYSIASLQKKTDKMLFLIKTKKQGIIYVFAFSSFWAISIPFFTSFFHLPNIMPLIIYLPIIACGFISAINRGYLQGNFQFIKAGIIITTEAISKFAIAVIFIFLGIQQYVYSSITGGIIIASIISFIFIPKIKQLAVNKKTYPFPLTFFATSSLATLSTMAFLSVDMILVKHFFTPRIAGEYALLSLTGKSIYFLGSLFNNFLTPFVANALSQKKDPLKIFNRIFGITFFVVMGGFIIFGLFGSQTASFLFGNKIEPIKNLFIFYGLAITFYTLATSFITYYLARKIYLFSYLSIINAFFVIVGLLIYHTNLEIIITVLFWGGISNLLIIIILHSIFSYKKLFPLLPLFYKK